MPRPQNWHHPETGEQPARISALPPPRPLARLLLPLPSGPSARPGNGAGVAGGWRRGGAAGAGAIGGAAGAGRGLGGGVRAAGLGALGARREVAPLAAREESAEEAETAEGLGGTQAWQSPEGAHPRRGAALCVLTLAPRAAAASPPSQRSPSGFPSSFSCLTCNNSQDPSGLGVLSGARESEQQG